MSKVATSRLHDGTRVQDAIDMFRSIISLNGMDKYTVTGWGRDMTIPILVDPQAWLGLFMIKSDEICISLLGSRMWNVVYVADMECVEGFRPVNMQEADPNDAEIDSYRQYAIAEDMNVAYSLRHVICKMAMMKCLRIEGTEVSSMPYKRLLCEKSFEPGDILPMHDQGSIFVGLLHDLTRKMGEVHSKEFNNTPTIDVARR